MILRPFVQIEADESMASWAARLAAVHAGETLVPFLHDLGLHHNEVLNGSDVAIVRLADVTGSDPEIIRKQTIQNLEWRKYDLRGVRFEAEFLKGPITSFCPSCLLDDDQTGQSVLMRRGRLMWRLRPVRTCPVHKISLVNLRHNEWSDRFQQMGLVVPESGASLERIAHDQMARHDSPLQTYVVERLSGATGPAWLDGQGIEHGARATEMVGASIEFGTTQHLNLMSADDWDRAGSVGYEFTKRGEEGIRDALDELKRRAWFEEKIPSQSGPQKIFGRLYQWLNFRHNRKENGPIREVIRQHILETMFVGPGTKLFGEEVVTTKKHTVGSLAAKSGVHRKTLRNALAGAGLIPSGSWKGGEEFFDATAGEEVAQQVFERIPQSQLPEYMNATRGHVIQILKGGFIPRMGVEGRRIKARASVSKRAVDEFLSKIQRQAQEVDFLPPGVYPIKEAPKRCGVSTVELINLILAGCLQNVFRIRGTTGYLALHADPTEIKAIITPGPPTKRVNSTFTLAETAKALRTSEQAISKLALAGLIETFPAVLSGRRPRGAIVTHQSLVQFQETYISLTQISSEINSHRVTVNKAIRHLGIKPVADPSALTIFLYRRADIPFSVLEGVM